MACARWSRSGTPRCFGRGRLPGLEFSIRVAAERSVGFGLWIEQVYDEMGSMFGGGLEGLGHAVDELEVPASAAGIAEARRLLDVLSAKVAVAEAAFEGAGGPEVEGYGSLAAFERHRCGLSVHESRHQARRARRVSDWPAIAEAWQTGVL